MPLLTSDPYAPPNQPAQPAQPTQPSSSLIAQAIAQALRGQGGVAPALLAAATRPTAAPPTGAPTPRAASRTPTAPPGAPGGEVNTATTATPSADSGATIEQSLEHAMHALETAYTEPPVQYHPPNKWAALGTILMGLFSPLGAGPLASGLAQGMIGSSQQAYTRGEQARQDQQAAAERAASVATTAYDTSQRVREQAYRDQSVVDYHHSMLTYYNQRLADTTNLRSRALIERAQHDSQMVMIAAEKNIITVTDAQNAAANRYNIAALEQVGLDNRQRNNINFQRGLTVLRSEYTTAQKMLAGMLSLGQVPPGMAQQYNALESRITTDAQNLSRLVPGVTLHTPGMINATDPQLDPANIRLNADELMSGGTGMYGGMGYGMGMPYGMGVGVDGADSTGGASATELQLIGLLAQELHGGGQDSAGGGAGGAGGGGGIDTHTVPYWNAPLNEPHQPIAPTHTEPTGNGPGGLRFGAGLNEQSFNTAREFVQNTYNKYATPEALAATLAHGAANGALSQAQWSELAATWQHAMQTHPRGQASPPNNEIELRSLAERLRSGVVAPQDIEMLRSMHMTAPQFLATVGARLGPGPPPTERPAPPEGPMPHPTVLPMGVSTPTARPTDQPQARVPTTKGEAIAEASVRWHVPPALVAGVITAESGGNQDAVSPAGAIGMGQFMPATAAGMHFNPRDPLQNIQGTARYLSYLLQMYHGDIERALAAYNWGDSHVPQRGPVELPPETRAYIENVRRYMRAYTQHTGQ